MAYREPAVREARSGDAEQLAPRLRRADRREISATTCETPLAVLRRGFEKSRPCFALVDSSDMAFALFGVVPEAQPFCATVWLLASDDLIKNTKWFLRGSRAWVERFHCAYPVLGNWVHAHNMVHLRWLEWCGFARVGESRDWGIQGQHFLRYEKRRDTVKGMSRIELESSAAMYYCRRVGHPEQGTESATNTSSG